MHLAGLPDYGDWVITTAFYSALHWMRFYLFPRKEVERGRSTTISDIDEYAWWSSRRGGRWVAQHRLLLELANAECGVIGANYQRLYDVCRTARYTDYRVSPSVVRGAVADMRAVRMFCDDMSSP